jgi:hypothetical protein
MRDAVIKFGKNYKRIEEHLVHTTKSLTEIRDFAKTLIRANPGTYVL